MKTKKILRFLKYFGVSCLVYYTFLLLEVFGLYLEEGDYLFALISSSLLSLAELEIIVPFGLFISMIIFASDWLKDKLSLGKLLKIGLILSILMGVSFFFFTDKVAPEIRITSFLNRYENTSKEKFTPLEKSERITELKKDNVKMMNIELINVHIDNLLKDLKSQENVISELALKTPDSILESNLSKNSLLKYSRTRNKNTSEYNRGDIYKLKSAILQHEHLEKKLRISNWEITKRYIIVFISLFFICFGIIIGFNFKKQHTVSLVCIGIVIYTQAIGLLTIAGNYYTDQINLIGLLYKLTIILAVFFYLTYRMLFSMKN